MRLLLGVSVLALACGRAGLDLPDGLGGEGAGSESGGAGAGGGLGAGGFGAGGLGAGGFGAGGLGAGGLGAGGLGAGGEGAGGSPGECVISQECEDFDVCTTNLCNEGSCSFPVRDDDQDGFVAESCGGFDCNDQNPNVFPTAAENCFDGADNDCNGVADCFDPACEDVPDCGCSPAPEDCDNGVDDDCDTLFDCGDPSCQGTPACGCLDDEGGSDGAFCLNGFDEDCDGEIDCDDADCADDPFCSCSAFGEFDCAGGIDDDCDLLVDCADPDCMGIGPCACVPPGAPEVCSDGADNDCDDLPDCADPECLASPACSFCEPEVCGDGVDNDCDLAIDCADSACNLTPGCEPTVEVCNNGLDDDLDGNIDCQDPECALVPICVVEQANCLSPRLIPGTGSYFGDTTGNLSETDGSCGGAAGEAVFFFVLDDPSFVHLDSSGTSFDSVLYVRTGVCNTGREIDCDDDSAGSFAADLTFDILYPGTYFVFLDGFAVDPDGGPNAGPFQLNVDIIENPPEVCGDGIDNDGDVFVDCADPDCLAVCAGCDGGDDPTPEFAPGRCTDGRDNDCDGEVDCGDDDCSASDVYLTECCNGLDETQNGVIDDFNCRCADTSDCQGDQICYDHTVRACGPPCDAFFGDVCPFVAPGSFCNAATQQCEF